MAGREVDRRSLQAQMQRQQEQLTTWSAGKTSRVQALVQTEMALTSDGKELSPGQVLTGRFREWRERRRLRKAIRKLNKEEQARLAEIALLLRQQQRLTRQINSLQTVRRMMGWWHTLHVPLGLTLFSAMFIHILAAIYYG
jgi:hypothetical protein